jgi:hypothetical protein
MEIRHHHYWQHYELKVVVSLEDVMRRGQYPPGAQAGKRRSFVGGFRLFGLGATAATYGIYVSSLLFFLVVGVTSVIS